MSRVSRVHFSMNTIRVVLFVENELGVELAGGQVESVAH